MYYVESPAISSIIDVMKMTVWGESRFPARFLGTWQASVPVVGWRDGYARPYGAHLRGDHLHSPVSRRHSPGDLNHLAPELPAPPSEQVSPDDDLHVTSFVLIPLLIRIDRGQHVGTGSRALVHRRPGLTL